MDRDYEDEEELEEEYLDLDDPSAAEMPMENQMGSSRQFVDQSINDFGSEILQQYGLPKELSDKIIKENGGKFSLNNLPGSKAGSEKSRDTLAKGIDKAAMLKGGKSDSIPKGLTQNKGPQNQAKQNADNRARSEGKEEGQESKLGQSGKKDGDNEKSLTDAVTEEVAKKGISAAAQAYGVPQPIADAMGEKLADPLVKYYKKQRKVIMIVSILMYASIFLLIGFFICLVASVLDIGGSSSEVKNEYLYGSGTSETLYDYLVDKGYCDSEISCIGSPAAIFYEKLKNEIDGNSNLTELQADVFITEFIFYDRNDREKFDGTSEEITYIANIIGSGSFNINNVEQYKEAFVASDGYFDKYRSDLLADNNSEEYKIKLYNKIVKSAQKTSKVQKKKEVEYAENGGGYYVNGKNVSNVKVRLLQCRDGNVGEPIPGEELVDFEKYILGVTYAENGGAPEEAVKAQAIAARTYSLLRGDNMGNAYNLGLKQEGGQWILSIRNCTEDQVYCDPDKGCWSDSRTGGSTIHSGQDSSKALSKPPLPADSIVRKAVEATNSAVLVGSNGKMINTPYTSTKQNQWNDGAKTGKDHFELLKSTYPTAARILISGPTVSGTFIEWKQCKETWSSIMLGKSDNSICSAGCYITSIAIQMARSGTKINATEFNPGILVKHLNSNNAFSDGGSLQSFSWSSLAPSFKYYTNVTLTGSEAQKAATIKSYQDQGLYVIIRAKTHQHWVALDRVVGDTVYMFDPATSATKLWEKYPSHDVTRITVFKNG